MTSLIWQWYLVFLVISGYILLTYPLLWECNAVADPGGDRGDHPPLELVPILKTYAKCAWPGPITPHPPWNVDDVTRAMSKGACACECPRVGVFCNFSEGGWRHADNVQGGGVLVNVQEWGCFSIIRRADDVTRTMSKGGGGACECLHPPTPSGNPVSAPVMYGVTYLTWLALSCFTNHNIPRRTSF